MMKKLSIFSLLLACSLALHAQNHVISVGFHGGGSHFLQKFYQADSVSRKAGGNGALDLGYTYYFAPKGNLQWGIHTGLGLGVSTSHLSGSLHETFTNTDMYGFQLDYTVDFDRVDERSLQLQMEIPLMAAMRWKGLVFNVGPKLMIPVWKIATQDHSLPVIDAYYPDFDVHVTDEMITGAIKTDDELNGKGQWCAPAFNFMLGFELGYEFRLKEHHLLGVMATLNMSAASVYKNKANGYVVKVGDITDMEYPVPEITIQSLSKAVVSNMHPLDFGVKVYYAFNKPSRRAQQEQPLADKPQEDQSGATLYDRTLFVERVFSDTIRQTVNISDTVTLQTRAIEQKYTAAAAAVTAVNFDKGSTTFPMTDEVNRALDDIAELLKSDSKIVAILSGYTCDIGSEEANNKIGLLRAKAVKRELIKRGVSDEQIFVETLGKADPLKPNDSEVNRSNNRNVEVTLGYSE